MIALGEDGRRALYAASSRRAVATRKKNGKPYPEAARAEAARRACERVNKGFGISKFERKVADVYRSLGFSISTSAVVRGEDGRYSCVFDIVIPSRRIVVECHGSYWHGGRWTWDDPNPAQARNLAREEFKIGVARSLGFSWRTVFEHDFRKDPRGACLAAVR
jgi:G:T-mismatch repair DNA endonuclease (very short patch repair protein)